MPMTFEEAEARFRQLQARVQRGEAISRAEYEEQVSMLSVTDDNGVLWEINPRTGKWMYFDGAEWVSGAPPGHDNSTVLPAFGSPGAPSTPPPAFTPPPAPQASASQPPPSPERPTYPSSPARRAPGKPPSAPPGGMPPQRPSIFAGREWVPLAIGAGVLLVCAVLLFFGGNWALSTFGKASTPTRIAQPSPVSSPLPTQVRLPSPTPLPPTPVPVVAQVAGDYANVRSRPSTSGTVVVRLQAAQKITLIAVGPKDGANVWYQINVPDKTEPGWIRSDVITIISGDPNTLPIAGATPTATRPAAVQPTPTLTPIGVIPATPKP